MSKLITNKEAFAYIVLTAFASLVNYLVYPLLGRILPSGHYTEMTISLTLLTQTTTFLSSIIAVTIGITKRHSSDGTKTELINLQALLFRVFLVIVVAFLISSPWTFPLIHTPVSYALPIGLLMLLALPITLISGFLNGKNKLRKLGFVILFAAVVQASFGVVAAAIFGNGIMTIYAMCLSQIFIIASLYISIREDGLPNPLSVVLMRERTIHTRGRGLALAVLAAGFSILALSLTQLLDLTLVQSIAKTDTKHYTDLYIISRMVFFAGMIFVWPFLGQINVNKPAANFIPFMKIIGIFIAISSSTVIAMAVAGDDILHLVFGSLSTTPHTLLLVSLSVLYKSSLLVITAAALYLIVMQRYVYVLLCLLSSALLYIYTGVTGNMLDTTPALFGINAIALGSALYGIYLVYVTGHHQKQ